MNTPPIVEAAICAGSLLGGFTLLVCTAFGRGRVAPHWIRVALWFVGPLTMAWAALDLTMLYGSPQLPASAAARLYQCKTLCAGACEGIFLLLLASGEFFRVFCRPKPVA